MSEIVKEPTREREPLPIKRVADLAVKPPHHRWLVHSLWGRAHVGLLFGAPKSSKSWLGLEMATSVASGTPCLGVYPVEDPGPVLIYLAEDSLEDVRARVESLCARRGIRLQGLDLNVVTAPTLRLDRIEDQVRLRETLEGLRPRLLLLDPLVRMHGLNENDSAEMSALLGYLRELQRKFDLAIMVVHHARKRGASQIGQTIRGSSDLYAWTDSSASLSRDTNRRLVLEVEHRSARSPDPIHLELYSRDDGTHTHLRLIKGSTPTRPKNPSIPERILDILGEQGRPHTNRELREILQINNKRLGLALADLEDQKIIKRQGRAGWVLVTETPESAQLRLPLHDHDRERSVPARRQAGQEAES